jgi:hypothetical protein
MSKGSARRKAQVPDDQFKQAWEKIFGNKRKPQEEKKPS